MLPLDIVVPGLGISSLTMYLRLGPPALIGPQLVVEVFSISFESPYLLLVVTADRITSSTCRSLVFIYRVPFEPFVTVRIWSLVCYGVSI